MTLKQILKKEKTKKYNKYKKLLIFLFWKNGVLKRYIVLIWINYRGKKTSRGLNFISLHKKMIHNKYV